MSRAIRDGKKLSSKGRVLGGGGLDPPSAKGDVFKMIQKKIMLKPSPVLEIIGSPRMICISFLFEKKT